jgi:signal transduction histidine kinase/DNA-binding response OmpR family regulator
VTTEAPDLHILVVDDERDIRDGSERILARKGYKVTKASNGEEALRCVEQTPFSIVLLDLKMPGMDGLEVLRLIRESHPDTLIIVITGYATIETAIEAMKRGAYDFMPKPFKPDQLRIVVDRAVERMRLTEEARRLEAERQRTLKDLHLEQSRTRTVIRALPDGVIVTTPDAHVALMNPACTSLIALPGDFVPGEHIGHYVKDEGFCVLVTRTSRGEMPEGQTSFTYEFSTEAMKYLRADSTTIRSETGECLGAVTVVIDISGLMELDKLKSEFVAKVSHELRSPLATIHEQLAMVLTKLAGDTPAEQRHLLARAKEKTQGLITMIGDLLDLSRIESGLITKDRKPIDLAGILTGVVEFLDSKAKGKGHTLTLELPEQGLPRVLADPQSLEIVFGNLITNAIHYTGEKGRIEVSAASRDDCVRVAVKDNGFGIEKRHQERIFEKFYRVKDDNTRYITGTGLGLPIVKGIVDDLGGKIELESEPGKGSTFTVVLPVSSVPPQESASAAAS